MKKTKVISKISDIQEVQIGLDNARKYKYADTKKVLKDGDFAYKIEIPTIIDNEAIYFENYKNAVRYLRDFE